MQQGDAQKYFKKANKDLCPAGQYIKCDSVHRPAVVKIVVPTTDNQTLVALNVKEKPLVWKQ